MSSYCIMSPYPSRLVLLVCWIGVVSAAWADPPVFSRRSPIEIDGAFSVNDLIMVDIEDDGDQDMVGVTGSFFENIEPGRVLLYENVGGSPPQFVAHVLTEGIHKVESVASADLDGDGDLDLAIAGHSVPAPGAVAWLENDGQAPPAFSLHVISVGGGAAFVIDTGDLDGDGDIDLFSGSDAQCKLAWFENDGAVTPTFVPHVIRPGIGADCTIAWDLQVADLDADGDLDAVAFAQSPDVLAWYENDGAASPTFVEHVIEESGSRGPVGVVDVNSDAVLDIVAVNDELVWYRGQPHDDAPPVFEKVVISDDDLIRDATPVDMDQDGDVDLLVGRLFGTEIYWYESSGGVAPTFVRRRLESLQVYDNSIYVSPPNVAGDLDGDGDVDVVVMIHRFDDDSIALAWFEQEDRFVRISLAVEGNSLSAASAATVDIDGDGDLDAALITPGRNGIRWLENDGQQQPQFAEHLIGELDDRVGGFRFADMDRDGDPDVVAIQNAAGDVVWFESNGASPPRFRSRFIGLAQLGAIGVATGDMDGDLDADVIVGSNRLIWHENRLSDGGPEFVEHLVDLEFVPRIPTDLVDMDGDGDLDILVLQVSADRGVYWYENSGGSSPTFTSRALLTMYPSLAIIGVLADDFDQDGDTDILLSRESEYGLTGAPTITWLENDGGVPPQFVEHELTNTAITQTPMFAVDVDADGDKDVVAAAESAGLYSELRGIIWFENRLAEREGVRHRRATMEGDFSYIAGVGDFDGDGDVDLFTSGETVAWHRNDGREWRGALSVLSHLDASGGESELAVDLMSSFSVEPRIGGPERLVVRLGTELDPASVLDAHVQVDCFQQAAPQHSVLSVDATTIQIDFAEPIADGECCTLSFAGMKSSRQYDVKDTLVVRALEGDLVADGKVTGGDYAAIKPYFGRFAVDLADPRYDLDRNGGVTPGDAALIKTRFGHIAPECP